MGLLIDHSPMGAASQDRRDVGLRDTVQFGYIDLGHSVSKSADFGDFFCAEKLLEHGNAADIDGVLSIGSVINPLKIGHNVVGFDAVNMIDDGESIGIWNKCHSHQTVDMDGLTLSVPEKVDVRVSEFIRSWTKDLAIYPTGLKPVADAVKTAYAPEIAHLVEISEVIDRNGSPFFCESDIHTAGYLSGQVGLMIKNPPRASTFGGFAVMAATSDICNTLQ